MFEKIIRKYGAVKKYDTAVRWKTPNPTFYIMFKYYTKYIVGDGILDVPKSTFLTALIF